MLCSYPKLLENGNIVGCARCMCCRINQRRIKSSRLILESACHDSSSFVTLTLNDYPGLSYNGISVRVDVAQLWQNRFRSHFKYLVDKKEMSSREIKFYTVGEYGTKTQRPHYHAIIFGISPDECKYFIDKTWKVKSDSLGFTYVGTVNKDSIHYCAGYVTKKATKDCGADWLMGRNPEFGINSKGISSKAVDIIADNIWNSKDLTDMVHKNGDVPMDIICGGRKIPLGSYFRRKLRIALGFIDEEYSDGSKVFKTKGHTPSGPSIYKEKRNQTVQELLKKVSEKIIEIGNLDFNKINVDSMLQTVVEPAVLNATQRFNMYDVRELE